MARKIYIPCACDLFHFQLSNHSFELVRYNSMASSTALKLWKLIYTRKSYLFRTIICTERISILNIKAKIMRLVNEYFLCWFINTNEKKNRVYFNYLHFKNLIETTIKEKSEIRTDEMFFIYVFILLIVSL
jgi:hypothetical protein